MLDHVFITLRDIERSVSFYNAALAPLGINERFRTARMGGEAIPISKASVQTGVFTCGCWRAWRMSVPLM